MSETEVRERSRDWSSRCPFVRRDGPREPGKEVLAKSVIQIGNINRY